MDKQMEKDNTKLENVSDSELAKYHAIANFYEVLWKESVSYELEDER